MTLRCSSPFRCPTPITTLLERRSPSRDRSGPTQRAPEIRPVSHHLRCTDPASLTPPPRNFCLVWLTLRTVFLKAQSPVTRFVSSVHVDFIEAARDRVLPSSENRSFRHRLLLQPLRSETCQRPGFSINTVRETVRALDTAIAT